MPHLRSALLAIAVALAIGSAAQAADPVEVEGLLHEGNRLRREGRNGSALPLFRKADDLAHTPRTSAQLGLVEFALGYSVDAAAHLAQALAASSDPWIQANRPVLEKSLVQVRATIGDVDVTGAPAGAEVLLNGRSVGRLPLPSDIPNNQGPLTVELQAFGYVTASTSIYVVGGKRVLVHLDLARERNLAPAPPQAAPAIALVDSAGSHPASAAPSPSPSTRTIVGWTLVAAGAISASTGGVLLLSASDCTPQAGFQCAHEPASRAPGWTLLGAGLAVGVAGTVVLVARPASHTEMGFGPSSVFLRGSL